MNVPDTEEPTDLAFVMNRLEWRGRLLLFCRLRWQKKRRATRRAERAIREAITEAAIMAGDVVLCLVGA